MALLTRRTRGTDIGPARDWDPLRVMRDMLRWDPFREMTPFAGAEEVAFAPAFDVKETKDAYVFEADLPGVKANDLDISLTGNRLTVSGRRGAEKREEGETYFAYERSYGAFSRAFTIPEDVTTDDVRADLSDGVLTVVLPKKPEAQPKKIDVKAQAGGGVSAPALAGKEKEKEKAKA